MIAERGERRIAAVLQISTNQMDHAAETTRNFVSAEDENLYANEHVVGWQSQLLRKRLTEFSFVLLSSYFILFLGMSTHPYIYDEGLVLTAAMRVAAGQVPHRDFYANYGPAQFYILAGLFKLFGESILVERLYDLLIRAFLVASVYAIVSSYCRRLVAACASAVTVLWLIGIHGLSGTPVIPVSLLNLIGSALILPVFVHRVSRGRMFAAGIVVGATALFRYDTGVALLAIHICAIAIAIFGKDKSNRLRTLASTLWPYLVGFAVVVLPPALYYLAVAPLQSFVDDMIVYPTRYYARSRRLPFPGIYLKQLEILGVYLPLLLAAVSLYVALPLRAVTAGKNSLGLRSLSEENRWRGFLVTFGLLTGVMYLKGYVRISLLQMYSCIIPSSLLIAVLFQNRPTFPRPGRISIVCLACLSVVAATWSALHEAKRLYLSHESVAERMLSSRIVSSPETESWCKSTNPLTRSFCFLPDNDHIRTIEFIDSHTRPDQQVYVGTAKHDRIFANDNIIYFGARRLPATHWSHFDPGLQNSYGIQMEMVHDLEKNAPPYIVLDSEFEYLNEPNESSRSTGVTLLDEYIHRDYQRIKDFGEMSVWQRINQ